MRHVIVMPHGELLIELRGVAKDYRALRPLRVERLELHAGQSLALLGFDQGMAEVFVDLVTAATLPDQGEIVAFGESTADIRDGETWLKALDRFGLLSERAVLVDQFTAEENLIIPFSLDLAGASESVRADARRLGEEIGLTAAELATSAGQLSPEARLRIKVGRALALQPRVLLAEHPNASLSGHDTTAFATDLSRIIADRGLASIVLTADRAFAQSIAEQVLVHEPATGRLKRLSGLRRWFS